MSDVASSPHDLPTSAGPPPQLHLGDLLVLPALAEARVAAGQGGLERPVSRVRVVDEPGDLAGTEPTDLLVVTGRTDGNGPPDDLVELALRDDDIDVAGVVVPPDTAVSPELAGAADDRGLPLVMLPADLTVDAALTVILLALHDGQAERLRRSEQIHRTLVQVVLRGDGLDEICRELSALIDAPTAILAPDGQVLGQHRLGRRGDEEEHQVAVVGADRVVVDGEERAAWAVPISAGSRRYGHVVALTDPAVPLGDEEVALQHTATVAALAITKQMEIQAVEDKYRSDLMHDLLTHVEDRDDALARSRRFGWDVQRRLIAIVVRIDERPELPPGAETAREPALARVLRHIVISRDPSAAVVQFSGEVVILTAAFDGITGREEAGVFVRRLVREVHDVIGVTVSAGQSRPVEDLSDIPTAYEQASRALVIGRAVQGRGAVQHFLDLGAYRLLWQVRDRAELAAFARETLGELADDGDEARSLRRTLQVLLETNGNVAEASRQLHYHYNSVRYRITKLESILGPFTTQASLRLDIHLALLVLSMHGIDDPV